MKTKRIFIILSILVALFMISSQVIAAPVTVEAKKTPPGLQKTPGVQATLKAEERGAKGKHENYKGAITAVDGSSITLTLKDGTSVTVALTAETRIRIAKGKNDVSGGLVVGMNVMVQAIRAEDDSLTAKAVVAIPGKPAKTHRVGIVTAYTASGSISIQAKDGQTYTFLLTADTRVLPAERLELLVIGARVTIISPRDVSSLDRTATGIVVHPAVCCRVADRVPDTLLSLSIKITNPRHYAGDHFYCLINAFSVSTSFCQKRTTWSCSSSFC